MPTDRKVPKIPGITDDLEIFERGREKSKWGENATPPSEEKLGNLLKKGEQWDVWRKRYRCGD